MNGQASRCLERAREGEERHSAANGRSSPSRARSKLVSHQTMKSQHSRRTILRKAFTLVELLVVIVILAILAALLWPVLAPRPFPEGKRSTCLTNLKQIGLGLIQYNQDYHEKYPASSVAWGQAVQPYIKSYAVFHCPAATGSSNDPTTDYFFNSRVAGVSLDKIQSPSFTIMAGDGLGGQPLNYSLSQLPATWANDPTSPARRHLDNGNYLYADGHVKPSKPAQITLLPPSKNRATFRVK